MPLQGHQRERRSKATKMTVRNGNMKGMIENDRNRSHSLLHALGFYSEYFIQIYTIRTVGSNRTRADLALLKDIFNGHVPTE